MFLIGRKFTSTNHKYYLLFEIFEWGHFHIIFNNGNDDGNKNFYHETALSLYAVHHAEMDVYEEGKHL